MISNATDMIKALKKDVFCGVILYQGPSALDGAPIVVIANRITSASANDKTGDMVQTFVIRSDIAPMQALDNGADASICGDCTHRPKWVHAYKSKAFIGPHRKRKRSCYVKVFQSVTSTFKAFKRGRYARPNVDYSPAILPDLFAGLAFRAGTYGDPTAAPFYIWRAATLKAAAVNGYTHQWRNPKFTAFKTLCMASADSVQDKEQANAQGWRTFRVRLHNEPKLAREVICPASKEAGRRASVPIAAHAGEQAPRRRLIWLSSITALPPSAGRLRPDLYTSGAKNMHSQYLRLNLHVAASPFEVIRAARAKVYTKAKTSCEYRHARHAYYRCMLEEHEKARDLFLFVARGGK